MPISVPLSRTPRTASSDAWVCTRSAQRCRTALRAAGAIFDQRPSSKAVRAAAAARSTNAASPSASVVSTDPSIGEITGICPPTPAVSGVPSIRCPAGATLACRRELIWLWSSMVLSSLYNQLATRWRMQGLMSPAVGVAFQTARAMALAITQAAACPRRLVSTGRLLSCLPRVDAAKIRSPSKSV